ncbi:MAG: phenylacetic acid degradation protein [Melioribacteraceae bacterium]|nr:MAG: phenylacetic acid degradation protein [Melioribacteraceae bacterium]
MVISEEKIWELLKEVRDPELPALDIIEMGIAREIKIESGKVTVVITPTYSGCPAMFMIETEIRDVLSKNGITCDVKTTYTPAWTTDWLTEEAREKLRQYGIAPPGKDIEEIFNKNTKCPFCGSDDTKLVSNFGSTACKSIHYCNSCVQPFEHFKCI